MDGHLDRHRDVLKNLSLFEGTCRCCGDTFKELTMEERSTGWIACKCGHVFPLPNKWKWH